MIFNDNIKELPFVIHTHTVDDKVEYQLSIQTSDEELQFLNFPRTGNMATISDEPNITRLFGTISEDTRSLDWLTFEGKDKSSNSVYEIFDKGVVKIGDQTEKYTEVFFKGEKLSDRWILRKIPNVFEKALFSEESVLLLWKPPKQQSFDNHESKSYNSVKCDCPTRGITSKFAELTRQEGEEMISKMSTDVMFNNKLHTFEGIGAAEGTWIDMYGEKYTYTPEFIVHTFNEQRERLKRGEKIVVGTAHSMDEQLSFNGEVTDIQLYQEPIYHIGVKGIYNGPSEIDSEQFGLSYEFKFKSVWDENFQSWVPFESKTERIDVIKRPACKICWINKVNKQENETRNT